MMKIFNKRKQYMVTIITKGKTENVEVIAESKNKAIQMVTDVLLNCNIFNLKSKQQFEIKVKRIKLKKMTIFPH